MDSYRTNYQDLMNTSSINHCPNSRDQPINNSELNNNNDNSEHNYGLSSKQALIKLHDEMLVEVNRMREEFSKRKFISWLKESISFKSELSKMRWPSVFFMTAQAIAHFIVSFILNVDNLATNWVGIQGLILSILLVFNLAVNHWDTKLRFKELLMKSEQILTLIKKCSEDKRLLKKWKLHNWNSAKAKSLFIPKSPCVHQTLTYRDESCLNLPDYLLVKGDIIHLYPGERAPGNCISLNKKKKSSSSSSLNNNNNSIISVFEDNSMDDKIYLKEGQIFDDPRKINNDAEIDSENIISTYRDENEKKNIKQTNGKNLMIHFNHAKLKRATIGRNFLMLSTPYIKCLRISLQRSHRRPVNSVEKECFIISRKYFETFVIPLVFLMSTIVTAIHYGYLDLTDSDQKIKTISIAYLLLRPSLTIMPFLPWMFPCLWLTVNAYGSARILCCGEAQKRKSSTIQSNGSGDENQGFNSNFHHGFNQKFENLLATPTAAGSSENKHDDDDLQDLQSNIKFIDIIKVCIDLIKGKSGHVWRSSNLLQVLGCLTSLCCIDKVGVLSWSNLTPEKVFVLTKNSDDETNHHHNENNVGDTNCQNNNPSTTSTTINGNKVVDNRQQENMITINSDILNSIDLFSSDQLSPSRNQSSIQINIKHTDSSNNNINNNNFTLARPEVLDVSQISSCFRGCNNFDLISLLKQQNCLQFDDLNWRRYISNLKPLGLAIIMNNCCEKSFGDYFRFYKHISYESILRCNLTPVIKRRCICSISKLIGFSKEAIKNYKYLNQIGIYKLIDLSSIKKGKLVSNLETTTKLKLPFPNMTCNIHEDIETGSYQVFSQGTADIVLDACVEYWDGKKLMPLDDSLRKKIMDFYHRTSLTSYCFAFSYTPLLKVHKLNKHYVELPPENSKFAPKLRKLANENQEEFLQNQIINLPIQKKSNDLYNNNQILLKDEKNSGSQYSSLENINIINSIDTIQDDRNLISLEQTTKITRRHLSLEELNSNGDSKIMGSKVDNNDKQSSTSDNKKSTSSQKSSKIINETLDELTDQVFVGMIAMQYQACPDFVALVEQLEHACIRFVHFSKENELRSRVFSEKMGLESGWNCHISLQSDNKANKINRNENEDSETSIVNNDCQIDISKLTSFSPTTRISNILIGNLSTKSNKIKQLNDLSSSCDQSISSSDEKTLYSWRSLPSIVMKLTAKIASEINYRQQNQHNNISTPDHNSLRLSKKPLQQQTIGTDFLSSDNNDLTATIINNDDDGFEDIANENEVIDNDYENDEDYNSTKDEGFGSLAFDMSNRAKLPKGIENIRPHLETIDNVPLQVSLFTDCTQELTKEMIEIMQEYGEIVCVIGSSSSRLNTSIFLQANASIGVEPLLPQCCTEIDDNDDLKKQRKDKKLSKREGRMNRNNQKRRLKKSQRSNKKEEPFSNDLDNANTINSQPTRVNNPRDRLGIGPPQGENIIMKSIKQQEATTSSTSSSSSESSSSSSNSSSDSDSAPESDFESLDSDYYSSSRKHNSSDNGELTDNNSILINNLDESDELIRELPKPSDLASKLASLPCSYSYNRKDPVNLYRLIMEARHFTFKMKNTFVCMICFALSISSAQFLASILFLPPMLSSGLTIWLTVVVVPLMSFSLMNTRMDSQVMKIAVGKNLQLKRENITFFVICYLIKFIPSIIVVVFSFGLIIAHSCKLTGFGSSSLGPCWMFTYVQHGNATSSETVDEDLLWSTHLLTAQVCAAFLIVLYFVVISAGFVHRSHLMWQRSPMRNKIWVIISLLLIFGQLIYNQLVLQINLSSSKRAHEFLASLPLHIWVISFIWPFLVIGINLLVKRAEIKATIRQQRRARFDFNTKLGMNSPF